MEGAEAEGGGYREALDREVDREDHHPDDLHEDGYEGHLAHEARDVPGRVGAGQFLPYHQELPEPHAAPDQERAHRRRRHYPEPTQLYEGRQDRLP